MKLFLLLPAFLTIASALAIAAPYVENVEVRNLELVPLGNELRLM